AQRQYCLALGRPEHAAKSLPEAPEWRNAIAQELQMSRKAFVATDAMREMVRKLARRGVPQDDIAKIVDCAPKTLRKHFRDELDRGAAAANAEMCRLLFAAAERGNIAVPGPVDTQDLGHLGLELGIAL